MPVVTSEKNGLMSPSILDVIQLSFNNVMTDNIKTTIRISARGKLCILFSLTRNNNDASLYMINFEGDEYNVRLIAGYKYSFFVSGDYLYIKNYVTWSECGGIVLSGTLDEIIITDTMPQDATELTVQ